MTPSPVSEPHSESGTDQRDRSLARGIVAVASAVHLGLGAWVISAATELRILADEAGTMAVSGYVAGVQPTVVLTDQPTYPLLPGALLAPLWRLPLDDTWRYRLALGVLVLVAFVTAWCLRSLAVRRLGAGPVTGAAVFAVTLLTPALTYTGSFVWAEQLAAAWFAALLVAATAALVDLRWSAVLGAGALAGAAPYVHGRFAAVTAVWLVVAIVTRDSATPPRDAAGRRAGGCRPGGDLVGVGGALRPDPRAALDPPHLGHRRDAGQHHHR